MQEELVTFDTAKLAQEKGFNEECLKGYSIDKDLLDLDTSSDCILGGHCKTFKNHNIPLDRYKVILYTCSTQSLLQKWLREVHNIDVTVQTNHSKFNNSKRSYNVHLIYDVYDKYFLDKNNKVSYFKTYEKALEIGLQEALKLVK